ncbi:polyprenyl synthetase family protein [Kutzneria sp. CA-103260]|uniref:polyprenyl synthetase family protein n=1 Tax=Kutzneria sp. CA-103260 TaxID=2802641 RepID=UPI001BA547D1|nr:polyprenyl synthetase family protein [Kutzneria sp. CA-103260]QUQ65527.1 trans-hexaprenyltranstransferase [Kutzneria sp. CA-103260]
MATDLGLTMTDSAVKERLESTIAVAGRCGVPWLDAGMRPLLTRPGKRLRPALVFAAAACGPDVDTDAAVNCAASVELMHLSSLIHDDLMDESVSRSGVPTLHVTVGRDAAILGGDYLLAAGARLAAEVSAVAARAWSGGYEDLCAGQAREMANCYRIDTTLDEYLAAVQGKTAALTSLACRLGGLCGGLSEPETDALADFGDAFGMVFQLVDDLMDLVSTEHLWTKPVRQDMVNGVYTAGVLAALARPQSPLRDLLGERMTPEQVDTAHEYALDIGATATLDLIDDYVGRAESALGVLPASTARARLSGLPRRYVLGVVESKVAPVYRRLVTPWTPTVNSQAG